MSEVVMIVGCPASGKGSFSKGIAFQSYTILNRDTEGGSILGLIPKMEQLLQAGKNVLLDNTFPTIEVRKPFIDLAKQYNVKISCFIMETSIEDAQINALFRMYDRYGRAFLSAKDIKESKIKDPNIFPPTVLFKYRKEYQKPNMNEGFECVRTIPFRRMSRGYNENRAIILDYDGTLRESTGEYDFPTKVSEVKILPGRKEVLQRMLKEGYLLLGVSNQSGIAKGIVTEQNAIDCFKYTNDQLGVNIDFHYCPHTIPPVCCYCRKPQAGLGVVLIEKYKLNPSQCIMVGDMKTDNSFATRLGFQYQDYVNFFK